MHQALSPPYCHQSHPSDHVMLLIQGSAGPLVPPEHSGTQSTTCHAKAPVTPLNASHSTYPHCFLAFSKHTTPSFIPLSLCICSFFCLGCIFFFQHRDTSYASFNTQLKSHVPTEVSLACWGTIACMTTLPPALASVDQYSVLASPPIINEVPEGGCRAS